MNPKPSCYPSLPWQIHRTPGRHSLSQHVTVSGVVLFQGHVLLVHHKRIGAWLPPGGHLEEMELPHEAVVREILEETGVRVDVLSPALPDTGDADAFFLPSPLCVHAVHAVERGVACYHVDMAYLCRPCPELLPEQSIGQELSGQMVFPELNHNLEVHGSAWVPLLDLSAYPLAKNVVEILALATSAASG